jgi:hypothetical protein
MPADALPDSAVPATWSDAAQPGDKQRHRWLCYRRHRGAQATAWGRNVAMLVQLLSRRRGTQLHRTPHILAHVQALAPAASSGAAAAAAADGDAMSLDELERALPQLASPPPERGAVVETVDEESVASSYAAWRCLWTRCA